MDRNGDISALGNDPVEGDPEANRNINSVNSCVQLYLHICDIYSIWSICIKYMYNFITYHQHLRENLQFGSFWRSLFVSSIPRCMYWKKMLLSETWFSSSQLMRCWVCSRRATYTVTQAKTWFTPKMKITHCRIVEMCLPRIIPRASSKLSSSVIASTAWQAKANKTALAVPKFEDLIKSTYLFNLSIHDMMTFLFCTTSPRIGSRSIMLVLRTEGILPKATRGNCIQTCNRAPSYFEVSKLA